MSTSTAVLKLKAVRAFYEELERAERAANRSSAPPGHGTSTPVVPTLVTTRRYSGRLQTGCVGGCFR
jgi:hypothetical protein